jgi:two-component system, NarL family, response regulator DesR
MESGALGSGELVRVLVAVGGEFLREISVSLISQARDMQVVASLPASAKAVPATLELCPDVVLLGGTAPDADMTTVISGIHDELPSCGILMITESRRPGDLRRAVAAGAAGYLLVDNIGPEDMIDALRRVGHGEGAVDAKLALDAINIPDCPLTKRELDVLQLAAKGAPSAEIARKLHLSSRTVRNYMSSIIGKTGGRNRIDAIRLAADAGWI